jgi:hypothetical protein
MPHAAPEAQRWPRADAIRSGVFGDSLTRSDLRVLRGRSFVSFVAEFFGLSWLNSSCPSCLKFFVSFVAEFFVSFVAESSVPFVAQFFTPGPKPRLRPTHPPV